MEAAYRWLLSTGRQPHDIASVGVSIGGNLAVNLALRQRDQGTPGPAAVLAVSPWIDPAMTNHTLDGNAASDTFLSWEFLELFRTLWLKDTGVHYDGPRVNLLTADLAGLPPTAVYYGTEELLAGEAEELTQRARLVGARAAAQSVPGGQHAFVAGAGRIPEVDAAINGMGRWLRSALALPPHQTPTNPSQHNA